MTAYCSLHYVTFQFLIPFPSRSHAPRSAAVLGAIFPPRSGSHATDGSDKRFVTDCGQLMRIFALIKLCGTIFDSRLRQRAVAPAAV